MTDPARNQRAGGGPRAAKPTVPRERTEAADERAAGSIRSVDRALSLLSTLSGRDAGLTELATAVDVPLPTAFRLARTLESAGYVSRTASGRYRLGPEIVRLGYVADANGLVRWLVRDAVSALRDATDECASFWIRSGTDRLCAEFADSRQSVRWIGHVGQRSPLLRGAAGKVLLAYSVGDHSDAAGLKDLDALRGEEGFNDVLAQLPDIRRSGFAVSVREASKDAWGVAAPVFANQISIGALGIGAPAARAAGANRRNLIKACRAAAANVGEQIERSTRLPDPMPDQQ